MKKDEFKEFVKKNPKLINFVKNNTMTWQNFYELYDLYGEDENIWKPYLSNEEIKNNKTISALTVSEVINWIKNIDLDSLKEGIGNLERVVGLIQDFTKKKDVDDTNSYKPRPLYKHFED